jgi:8-oxo-dGTP pyrophosphatase MutT (NUDIX family)
VKKRRSTRLQYGALPYRFADDTSIEVLLVTSRETKRWVLPKGWPIKGLTPANAAAREAYEEAGVYGIVARRVLGRYKYEKRLEDRDACVPCEVQVFLLAVKKQVKDWPEVKERTVRWFSVSEAAAQVEDDRLGDLILRLVAKSKSKLKSTRAPNRRKKDHRRTKAR